MSDLLEDRSCQLPGPAAAPGQHLLQVSWVLPQPLDLQPEGRQPLDHSLADQPLVAPSVQPLGLGHGLLHTDPRHGGVDGHQVGHARPSRGVKGHLRGEVSDGTADLEGDVVRGVRDEDGRHGLGVRFGHFGRRVT